MLQGGISVLQGVFQCHRGLINVTGFFQRHLGSTLTHSLLKFENVQP